MKIEGAARIARILGHRYLNLTIRTHNKAVRFSERKDGTDDEALCWAHQVNMCALEALNKDFIFI